MMRVISRPADRHAAVFRELLAPLGVRTSTSDAALAALAIEHGALLCSADTDFARARASAACTPLGV